MPNLSSQLITVAILVLQKQNIHDSIGTRTTWNRSYDYIVIGAGTAGAVVANRLSESPNVKVLLIEAGGPQTVTTDIPELWTQLRGTDIDWNYTTVPQINIGLVRNSVFPQARGKIIGGTSTINALVNVRGNKKGFSDWVTTYGAKGWSYDEVLPYFIKSENNTDLNVVQQNPGYHGTKGPVAISSWANNDPMINYCLKAFNEFGLETVDINGAKQRGAGFLQGFFGSNGLRSSSGTAYIDPNPHPNNLHILTNAFVTKILINESNGYLRAFGVEFIKNNEFHEVVANKEIILSAGVFNSPKLLMLSGIGPKAHLNEMNIDVKADLPVGAHLHDHLFVPNYFTYIKDNTSFGISSQLDINQLYQLLANGSGPLIGAATIGTFYNSRSNEDKEWPNGMAYVYVSSVAEFYTNFKNRVNEWKEYLRPYLGKPLLSYNVNLVRVRSYGSVRLQSNNPFDKPLIDPKYLTNPQDLEDLVQLIKFMINWLTNSSISQYIYFNPNPIPGCNVCPNRNFYECDQYIRCYIRQLGSGGDHPVGTCRMGAIDRSDVVVDSNLKVLGVSSLRVCDSSVMPSVTNGNTATATIMIGEKCSQIIKNDNKY